MALSFHKAVILGATGPTGKHLARALRDRHVEVRVVSRSMERLARSFPGFDGELIAADMLDADATLRATDGCDLVFDCIGLPADRLADHPRTATNVARAVERSAVRCIHVSSYWAYLPVRQNPVAESHPRTDGPWPVRMRREAEDILRGAGAAVVNLPDFYGPEVHTSTLQRPLEEAVAGARCTWVGRLDARREYVYVPDAMRTVVRLAEQRAAYGELWIVPGAGPITPRRVVEIAGRVLGREVKARAAGSVLLRLLALFSTEIRQFKPMIPCYVNEVWFDGSRIRRLLGEVPVTSYESGIESTLRWLAARQGRG